MATTFKSAKQGLKYYKGTLTRAISEFEAAIKELEKKRTMLQSQLPRKSDWPRQLWKSWKI